ncbi:DUF4381 domain-containing protein [Microbulbifer aggregans]|uniref:DUF4381 domain-containing protein n=1 Tax=Microbulbifer aggregans TaxID=1769779 RepID=UPI001CFCB783|nr:DUF4381 domain-containing protein [Microbulbifer aggregans]
MLPTMQQAPQPNQPALTPEMQALLGQLKDIHEPSAIGWWPPAPGWWLLGALILLAIAGAAFLYSHMRQKRLKNRYRIEGIRLLDNIDPSSPQAVEAINIVLKRVAVAAYGRDPCAPLTGQRWIKFLEDTAQLEMDAPARRALLESLYQHKDADSQDFAALRDFAVNWVREHEIQDTAAPLQKPVGVSGV